MNIPQPKRTGNTLEDWKTWEGRRYQEVARVEWGAAVALLGGTIRVTVG